MQIKAYQSPLVRANDDLYDVLALTLPETLPERSVVVITSKIISLCQSRTIPIPADPEKAAQLKDKLVLKEADAYSEDLHPYGFYLTLKNHHLIASSGIDESNTGGFFLLWPEDVQQVAIDIWHWLKKRYGIQEIGVIITDSHSIMMRWGVFGTSLAWCGFLGLRSKVGEPDLFGKPFLVTTINDAEALSVAAVYEMGETNEQTPVAIISHLPQLVWQNRPPTDKELHRGYIDPAEDLFGGMIKKVDWQKGGEDRERKGG